jgi:hypothetical protein
MKHLACALALAGCTSPALTPNAAARPAPDVSLDSAPPDAAAAASAPATAAAPAPTTAPVPTTVEAPVAPPSTFRWRVVVGTYGGIAGGVSHVDVYDGGAILDASRLAPGGHGAVATSAELAEVEQLLVDMKARGELWKAPAQPPSADRPCDDCTSTVIAVTWDGTEYTVNAAAKDPGKGHVPARNPFVTALEGPEWPNLRAARLRDLVGSMGQRTRDGPGARRP